MVGSFSFLSRYSVQGKSIIIPISRIECASTDIVPIEDDGAIVGEVWIGIRAVVYPPSESCTADGKADLPCPYREIWRGFQEQSGRRIPYLCYVDSFLSDAWVGV